MSSKKKGEAERLLRTAEASGYMPHFQRALELERKLAVAVKSLEDARKAGYRDGYCAGIKHATSSIRGAVSDRVHALNMTADQLAEDNTFGPPEIGAARKAGGE